jgi:hypothetical protein
LALVDGVALLCLPARIVAHRALYQVFRAAQIGITFEAHGGVDG